VERSDKETGGKRGCIGLTHSDEIKNSLVKLEDIKLFE